MGRTNCDLGSFMSVVKRLKTVLRIKKALFWESVVSTFVVMFGSTHRWLRNIKCSSKLNLWHLEYKDTPSWTILFYSCSFQLKIRSLYNNNYYYYIYYKLARCSKVIITNMFANDLRIKWFWAEKIIFHSFLICHFAVQCGSSFVLLNWFRFVHVDEASRALEPHGP